MSADMSAAAIKRGLKTSLVGREIMYFPSLISTMDTARSKARHGAPEGAVVIAGEQTGGRGRLKRGWLTPPGNIAFSIILRPEIQYLPYLIMIASLAVARSIEQTTGLVAQIKWPNDVLIGGRKVCGILLENELKGDKVAFSIVGIGINWALRPAAYREIALTATSLESEGARGSRPILLRCLFKEFERLYLSLPDGTPIFKDWRARLVTLGKMVQAESGETVIEGVAESVTEDGALWIRRPGGELTPVVAGDVTLKSANSSS